jgi:predicted CoA-binding protein
MTHHNPADAELRRLVQAARRIAVVGLSNKPDRPSHEVASYLQRKGFEIIPVNPAIREALGVPAVASLRDIGGTVDIVCVFRRAEDTPDVARDAVAIGARALWLQQGIVSEEAGRIAREGGLDVVMDRCLYIEHARLAGRTTREDRET